MDIKVIEKDSLKVVGISWNGCYTQSNAIPSLFKAMEERLQELPNKTNEPVLIAPFHDRETEFTYYVTAPVEEIDEVPEGMVGFTIPRKNYVFTTHVGKTEDVEHTYRKLFTWMEEYGYERDYAALGLEVYKQEHREQNFKGDLHFEIYLPVKVYK